MKENKSGIASAGYGKARWISLQNNACKMTA
jgi:hypothetical protein